MERGIAMSKEKLEEMIVSSKIGELLCKKESDDEKKCYNWIIAILAIIGAVVAVAAIAYGVYRYFTPDYLDDFDDDYDDDFVDEFDDDFEDDFEDETSDK